MKRIFAIVSVLFLCLCASLPSRADNGKIYTRKNLLSDFPEKILKVVLSPNDTLNGALRREMVSRWVFSPYEFCTAEEYSALQKDNNHYFLLAEDRGGVYFLSLLKGGDKSDSDRSKRPFEVVSLPVACVGRVSFSMVYMPAFVDIIQNFALEATKSEVKAYSSLKSVGGRTLTDKIVSLVPEEAAALFLRGEADTLCGLVLSPSPCKDGDKCYKMLISADTHELYFLKSHTVSAKSPAGWLPKDLSRIYAGL